MPAPPGSPAIQMTNVSLQITDPLELEAALDFSEDAKVGM